MTNLKPLVLKLRMKTTPYFLGATRVECAEWLIARNASHHKLTGENNSYYEEFAKEIGVKL